MIKLLNRDLIESVAQQGQSNTRLRQNHNFHKLEEKVQRLLIGMQPGTYVRPHQHKRAKGNNGFEMLLVLEGSIGAILFNEEGQIIHKEKVSADGTTFGIELPEGIYHTVVALMPNTVILEVKEGPYDSSNDKTFLSCFPEEGTLEAQQLVKTWYTYF